MKVQTHIRRTIRRTRTVRELQCRGSFHGVMGYLLDPSTPNTAEIEAALGEAEEKLLDMIRRGASGAVPLGDVVGGLQEDLNRVRILYRRLDEALERRDLAFEAAQRLQGLQTRALWIYRKCRLEHFLFSKLQIERSLRDALYREFVETYQELSVIDEAERRFRGLDEASLSLNLLADIASEDS